MKQQRRYISLAAAIFIPFVFGGQVFAASPQITQQITVTAVVPSHRDIILDDKGAISTILSNTLEDVTPTAYAGTATPQNQKDLTPELLQQYRLLVPEGTSKYGVLYRRTLASEVVSRITSKSVQPSTPQLSSIFTASWQPSPRS